MSSDDAMQALRQLKSVKYQYKRDKNNTQMVDFIAEDVPEILATHSRKALNPMKIVAVLTKALQVQDESLQNIKKEVAAKDAKIADMEEKLSCFEMLKQRLDKMEKRFEISE